MEEQLLAEVAAQGLVVREAKAAKSDSFKAELDKLLALKAKFKEVTGKEFPAPNKGSSKKDKKAKSGGGGGG